MSIFTTDAIMRKLQEVKRASATSMAKETGLSISTCSRHLKALARDKRIGTVTVSYRQGIDATVYLWKGE